MRTESAYEAKRAPRRRKRWHAEPQREPRHGTKLRELWDLLHLYRGEVIEIPKCVERFGHSSIQQLCNFYGCDIRVIGSRGTIGVKGGSCVYRWVLAGEWFGPRYVDYIAERLQKLGALK